MDLESYLKNDLAALLDAMRCRDVQELEVQRGEMSVRLHRSGFSGTDIDADQANDVREVTSPTVQFVAAPLVGTFYRAAKPGQSPLVAEGSHVEHDTVVGIIEALQVLTDVTAGVKGVVTRVLETDGHPVEYGQALFEVTLDD
jgi:acetyl-CoA carboxylase biotin carboxyl carrier protein